MKKLLMLTMISLISVTAFSKTVLGTVVNLIIDDEGTKVLVQKADEQKSIATYYVSHFAENREELIAALTEAQKNQKQLVDLTIEKIDEVNQVVKVVVKK